MNFTDEQLSAIESRNENLLVSAAAGSGKTSVLVERIIRKVTDKDAPVDIDRLLVMTFTKAAAAQMKEKILKAIEEKRSLDPMNTHLIRQSVLFHNAKITTIHGFCLDVIKNHFQEIGLDPDFRVADEAECKLLKQDVIEALLEREYEAETADFTALVEAMATGKNDKALPGILDKLYDYSMSDPDPDKWLDKCLSVYTSDDDDPDWLKIVIDNARMVIEDVYNKCDSLLLMCTQADGPYMYEGAARSDLDCIDDIRQAGTYDEIRDRLLKVDWVRLAPAKKNGPYFDPDLAERFKKIRNENKAAISKLLDGQFRIPLKEQLERISACAKAAGELVRLTRSLTEDYSAIKRDKKIVDFSDLEHMCIKILKAKDGNTAERYRDFFEEIYVDEYQDSNLVQEELLNLITRGDNLFMVGDVKQSIYSFRLARPGLFMDKYNRYKSDLAHDEGSPDRRIDLKDNFRSRASVLDTVNQLFEKIMTKDFGGIEYDDNAALHLGAKYAPVSEKLEKSELILIEGEKGVNMRELEARVIASRIRILMKEQTVSDATEDDPYRVRPVRYSDIVILLRSQKGWDETFKEILAAEGIPVHSMSRTGYFTAMEVSILLDYLTVLDNPLQDIPMMAVLKSPFGGFTDEEIAIIRSSYPDRYLYGSLKKCAGEETEDLRERAVSFLESYARLREKTGYTPVYEILLELIDGDYGTFVTALPDGRKKRANLNMLLKKAQDYGNTSYKGLFHFVRYIETLKKYEIDYGEANILDENDDTVRIMTIHKSKGLEFPVCFIAGMHKGYNYQDIQQAVIPDIDLGLGIDLVDPEKRVRYATLTKAALATKKMMEINAEEERVLYVAMTRAREKLIMTGVVNKLDEALARDVSIPKCDSYLDLVLHGLNNGGIPSLIVNTLSSSAVVESVVRETVDAQAGREEIRNMIAGRDVSVSDERIRDLIRERFLFTYPYDSEKNVFEKISVSELKKRSMEEKADKELPDLTHEVYEEERVTPYVPDFIRESEKEIPATLHGTAVHRIFELWDYNKGTTDEDIEQFLNYVKEEGLMEEDLISCVKIREVSDFVNSPLAQRMKKAYLAGQLYREQPFICSLDGLLIQGIIDAYFIENDKIVIVDYKTDRVDDIKDLAQRYHVQLEYYARALNAMLDMPVSDLIIYSTRYKDIVSIPYAVVN